MHAVCMGGPLVVCVQAPGLAECGVAVLTSATAEALRKQTEINGAGPDAVSCLQALPVPDPLPDCGFLLLSLSTTPGYFIVTKLVM